MPTLDKATTKQGLLVASKNPVIGTCEKCGKTVRARYCFPSPPYYAASEANGPIRHTARGMPKVGDRRPGSECWGLVKHRHSQSDVQPCECSPEWFRGA